MYIVMLGLHLRSANTASIKDHKRKRHEKEKRSVLIILLIAREPRHVFRRSADCILHRISYNVVECIPLTLHLIVAVCAAVGHAPLTQA